MDSFVAMEDAPVRAMWPRSKKDGKICLKLKNNKKIQKKLLKNFEIQKKIILKNLKK
jgi:hypothetical protein